MAFSTTLLLWGLLRYPEAYAAAGELDNMLSCVKWPLDYFVKAHNKDDQLYVMVSDMVDHCKAYVVHCQCLGACGIKEGGCLLRMGLGM